MKSTNKNFFIIGAQRSGTTLLRLILNAHSQIVVPREAFFLMPLLKKKYLNGFISGNTLKSFNNYLLSKADIKSTHLKETYVDGNYNDVMLQLAQRKNIKLIDLINEVFSSYCRNEGKSIWGNKTPSFFRNIDILFALFPNAKFIHIVRDGRDVFDSFRKIDSSKSNVAVIALDWNYKLFRIEKSLKKIPANNKVTILYEDLLNNCEKTIKHVCSVIGVEYENSMLDYYKSSHKHTSPTHSKLIFKPLNENNMNKWKKNLTPREAKIFNLLAGYYLKKYNYEIESSILNISDALLMLKCLIVGLPKRSIQVIRAKKLLENGINSI